MSLVSGSAFVGQFGDTSDANHSGKIELEFRQSDGKTALDITGKTLYLHLRKPDNATVTQHAVTVDDGAAGLGSFAVSAYTFFADADVGDWDAQVFDRDNADLTLATYNAPFARGHLTLRAVVGEP